MAWWRKLWGRKEEKEDLKGLLLALLQEGGPLPEEVRQRSPEELTDVMAQLGWRLRDQGQAWWDLADDLGLTEYWEGRRKSPKAEDRAFVMESLGKIDHGPLLDWFFEGLRDKSDLVGLAAADALGRSGREEVPDRLGQAFVKADEGYLPDRVARSMVMQGVRMLGVLRGLLSHREEEIRAKALEVLAQMDPKEMGPHRLTLGVELLPQVLDAMQDDSPLVREKAIETAGRWSLGGAAAMIVEALGDPAPKVRAKGAWALGVLGFAEGREALEKLCCDEEWLVQEAARKALEQLEGVKIS